MHAKIARKFMRQHALPEAILYISLSFFELYFRKGGQIAHVQVRQVPKQTVDLSAVQHQPQLTIFLFNINPST